MVHGHIPGWTCGPDDHGTCDLLSTSINLMLCFFASSHTYLSEALRILGKEFGLLRRLSSTVKL